MGISQFGNGLRNVVRVSHQKSFSLHMYTYTHAHRHTHTGLLDALPWCLFEEMFAPLGQYLGGIAL